MTTRILSITSGNMILALKRLRIRLSDLVKREFDKLAKFRRVKHRKALGEEALRHEEMLELRSSLRSRLRERLGKK